MALSIGLNPPKARDNGFRPAQFNNQAVAVKVLRGIPL